MNYFFSSFFLHLQVWKDQFICFITSSVYPDFRHCLMVEHNVLLYRAYPDTHQTGTCGSLCCTGPAVTENMTYQPPNDNQSNWGLIILHSPVVLTSLFGSANAGASSATESGLRGAHWHARTPGGHNWLTGNSQLAMQKLNYFFRSSANSLFSKGLI